MNNALSLLNAEKLQLIKERLDTLELIYFARDTHSTWGLTDWFDEGNCECSDDEQGAGETIDIRKSKRINKH